MLRRRETDGVVWYESPRLAAIGVKHAFSTRVGGVSAAPFASLNLGNPSGTDVQDSRENIDENYRRILAAAGLGEGREVCRVHQVHGAAVIRVRAGAAHDRHAQADALVSSDPSRVISVRTADCVPVLLASGDGRVVAVVHAGWRGVAAGVVRNAVVAMGPAGMRAGVVAAIGPSIGMEAFEVGPEVIDDLEGAFGVPREGLPFVRSGRPGKWHVALREAVGEQLRGLGVRDVNIDTTDRCTYRDAAEFYSHRRDRGVTGRMGAFVIGNT